MSSKVGVSELFFRSKRQKFVKTVVKKMRRNALFQFYVLPHRWALYVLTVLSVVGMSCSNFGLLIFSGGGRGGRGGGLAPLGGGGSLLLRFISDHNFFEVTFGQSLLSESYGIVS